MKVQRGPDALPSDTAACIGAFDGMHLGHQALLARGRELCRHVAVVTFDPHPARILAPDHAPRLLQTGQQRERTCAELGVDALALLEFDHAMSRLDPAEFVRRFLVDGLSPGAVVVGEDFRFGKGRAGGPELLRELLEARQTTVEVVAELAALPDADGNTDLSSSAIRSALDRGHAARARALLGRWHSVAGTVVRGARRGRELGYPTANVECADAFLPALGIYATALVVWDERSSHRGRVFPSVASLGVNPTFTDGAEAPVVLEAHALDVDLADDLYDMDVEVSFIHHLRNELPFETVDALVAQIDADVAAAAAYLTPQNLDAVIRPR